MQCKQAYPLYTQ